MKKLDYFILSTILIIAFIFRLYKINTPLADLHSWRQADTASVARNYVKNGIDLFHPVYDDLSNVQSGIDNPNGYRMVEFPIYNAIVAILYKIFPIFTLEIWGRLTTIIFSGLILFALAYIVKFTFNSEIINKYSLLTQVSISVLITVIPIILVFLYIIPINYLLSQLFRVQQNYQQMYDDVDDTDV